jgi:hypothetical protein
MVFRLPILLHQDGNGKSPPHPSRVQHGETGYAKGSQFPSPTCQDRATGARREG